MVLGTAALALVLFHLFLLGADIRHGRVLDPVVAARWLAALALFGALLAFRRLGVPLLWGRRAVVVWLLVLFLHSHVQATGHQAIVAAAEHSEVALWLVLAPATAAVGVVLLGLMRRLRRHPIASRLTCLGRPGSPRRLVTGPPFWPHLAPRPPPAA